MAKKVALLLEDEGLIAWDIEEMLEREGYVVETLGSGAAGLKWLLEHSPPDIAIIDPELADGRCNAVASHLVNRNIPFVVHSAAYGLEDEPFGAGVWVSKPSTDEELLAAIHDAISRVLPFSEEDGKILI